MIKQAGQNQQSAYREENKTEKIAWVCAEHFEEIQGAKPKFLENRPLLDFCVLCSWCQGSKKFFGVKCCYAVDMSKIKREDYLIHLTYKTLWRNPTLATEEAAIAILITEEYPNFSVLKMLPK